ncbi:MAG: hypothetical protein ACJ8NS_06200 [Chthoniobacterales bacterium]
MTHSLFAKARTVLFGLLACSPAFLTLRLISRYGVDLPVADDWTLVPFVLKAHDHTLSLVDFFAQHNEHRYVFPKLLLLVLTPLTSGSIKAEMFCSVILAILASGGLWYLLCRTVETSLDKKLLLLGLFNLLLFSPVQAGNWTWGCQFVLFLVNVWLVAGIVVAVSPLSLKAKFLGCIVIAVAATFTFGGGVVTWAVVFPVALLYETRVRVMHRCWWLAAWLFAAAITIMGYFFRYVKPSVHPPLAASHKLINYFRYISIFLGAHLSKAMPNESVLFPAILGTTLMVGYLVGILWTLRSPDAAFKKKMLPWLGVGAYALANAALAAITRIGFGVNQGLDSRYTTFSLYISIAVIGMFAVVATKIQSEAKAPSTVTVHLKWVMAISLTVLLISYLYTSAWGISLFKAVQKHRLHGKAALLFTNVLDSEAAHTNYLLVDAAGAREAANNLNRGGFIHPPLIQDPDLSKLDSRPQPAGFLESVTSEGQTCKAFGWAMIPKGFRPADAVLLAYDDPTRGPIAFALTVPITPRPDVAQVLHDYDFGLSGWSCEFERSRVPPGDHRITAWAFDAEKSVLFPLSTPQMIH